MISDIVGKKFNKLTVLEFSYKKTYSKSRYKYFYKCLCDCGKETIVCSENLKSGNIKSCGCSRGLEKGQAAFNSLYYVYKRNAKMRGIKFKLTKKQFRDLTKQKCYYCGEEPHQIHNHTTSKYKGSYTYNGIDRIDNDKGYSINNCITACGVCNRMRRNMSQEEFLSHINKIYGRRYK